MRRSALALTLLMATACVARPVSLDDGLGDDVDTGDDAGDSSGSSSSTDSDSSSTESGTDSTETDSTETDTTETGTTDTGTETDSTDTTGGEPFCGNGIVEADEECDDGNDKNIDNCVEGCKLATCGDGFTYKYFEQCDDANDVDDDVCSNICLYNLNPLCADPDIPSLGGMHRLNDPDGPGGVQFCDRLDAPNTSPDWLGPGWYRIDGWGNAFAFSPGQDYACGTSAGGWINDEVPSVEDGPTPVEICFAFGGDDCAWSVEATFISCYFDANILWLPEVPDCDLGYCTIQIIPD